MCRSSVGVPARSRGCGACDHVVTFADRESPRGDVGAVAFTRIDLQAETRDEARRIADPVLLPCVVLLNGLGLVMMDFASITNVKRRACPFSSRSVYFEVSSRCCQG